uniref:Uncharacterized protein n=1 Tax=Plectus sambesii TaxID=2011161 RepID=A0A914UYS0_9BILA
MTQDCRPDRGITQSSWLVALRVTAENTTAAWTDGADGDRFGGLGEANSVGLDATGYYKPSDEPSASALLLTRLHRRRTAPHSSRCYTTTTAGRAPLCRLSSSGRGRRADQSAHTCAIVPPNMVSLTAASVELLFVSAIFSVLMGLGLCRRIPPASKRSGQHQPECRPSDSELHSWGRWASRANHTSRHLSLLAPVLPEMELRRIVESELPLNPVLAGDDGCPARLNQLQGDPLMVRSLCPWYWRINYDPLRIPATLPEARCRCERAVTGNRLFACHPLTMRIRVGRYDDNCGQYVDDEFELSVACISVVQPKLVVDPIEFTGVQKTFVIATDHEI